MSRSLVTACLVLAGASSLASAQSITPIFPLPDFNTVDVYAISADGSTVVGMLRDIFSPGYYAAFRWTKSGGTEFIAAPPGGTQPFARDVSFNGETVLGACTINGVSVPFLSQPGQVSAVPVMREGFGLSSDGRFIAGNAGNGSVGPSAVWSQAGGRQFLPSLGDQGSFAVDVNHNGAVVVGITQFSSADGNGRFRATKWVNGTPTILSNVELSEAQAVSGDGSAVAGAVLAQLSGGFWQAMRWGSGGETDLGIMPNARNPFPSCISTDGRVVGGRAEWMVSGERSSTGWIWTSATGMVEINEYVAARGVALTGWVLGPVRDVSIDGMVITGDGAYLGQYLPYVVDLRKDTDGDGLYDDWEMNGIPYLSHDGQVLRYELPDAHYLRKDLYVEIDSMPGLMPPQGAIDRVVAAFDTAPVTVDAPGGLPGIALHVQFDDTNVPMRDFLSSHGATEFFDEKADFFGTFEDQNHPDRDARLKARAQAYRYCMSVLSLPDGVLGVGEVHSAPAEGPRIGGNDLILALGNYVPPPSVSIEDMYAAAFMHELGHTLGLFHGGGKKAQNYNPNHFSVMNYFWCGARDFAPPGLRVNLDYQRQALPMLDKANLYESTPIGGLLTGVVTPYFVRSPNGVSPCLPTDAPNPLGSCTATFVNNVCINYVPFFSGVDWNNDGVIAPAGERVCANPNQGGMGSVDELELVSVNEWALLDYNFRDAPSFLDRVVVEDVHVCHTIAEELFLSTLPAAPPAPPCNPPVAAAPTPASAPACQAGGAFFDINPTGAGPFHVQWRRFDAASNAWVDLDNGTLANGSQISGVHGPRLLFENAKQADFGTPTVRLAYHLTDACSQATQSGEATLTFPQVQVSAASPTAVASCPGASASFSVSLDPPGTYDLRWLCSGFPTLVDGVLPHGTVVSGSRGSTLTLSNVSPEDFPNGVHTLSCSVDDSCTQGLSVQFAFSPTGALVASQSDHVNLPCSGGDATLSVTAVGPGPIQYRWHRDGQPLSNGGRIAGAQSATLTLTPAIPVDAGFYTCEVITGCGEAASGPIHLRAGTPVAWPSPSGFACPGQTGVLRADVASIQPCTFQWMRNGASLAEGGHFTGTQTGMLTINGVQEADYGDYELNVENRCGTAIIPASFTMPPPIMIVQQPQWQRGCANSEVNLSVRYDFPEPVFIWWEREQPWGGWWVLYNSDIIEGNRWCGRSSGVNTENLRIQWRDQAGCETRFRVRVGLYTNCTEMYSEPVWVDRLAPSDFNGDGDIGTDADIEAFFACLGGNCCPACGSVDYNNDGDIGTDADIESFFRVLGGGPC